MDPMERVARALAGALLLGLLALATWRADGGAPSWVLPLAAVTERFLKFSI